MKKTIAAVAVLAVLAGLTAPAGAQMMGDEYDFALWCEAVALTMEDAGLVADAGPIVLAVAPAIEAGAAANGQGAEDLAALRDSFLGEAEYQVGDYAMGQDKGAFRLDIDACLALGG